MSKDDALSALERAKARSAPPVEKPVAKAPVGKPRMPADMHNKIQQAARASQQHHTEETRTHDTPQDELDGRVALGEHSDEVKAQIEVDEAADRALRTGVIYSNSPIDNPRIRAAIEARCEEMDFAGLMQSGRLLQSVPVNQRFTVTYQTITGAESWWIEEEATERHGGSAYLANLWMSYAKLCLSLVALGSRPFPKATDDKGKVTRKGFEKKWAAVFGRLPDIVVSTLAVNEIWFRDRVQQLMLDDFAAIKNG